MNEIHKNQNNPKNLILHVDGDAFFVSCEVARNPSLRGKMVIVGEERGIASALTYEAKKRGITRGMPIFQIRKFFPSAIILKGDYRFYSQISHRMAEIVRKYADKVEHYSIDECFASILNINKDGTALKIKNDLENSLGVTFSIGVARTKVLAKIASKHQKPASMTIISPELEDSFLAGLSTEKIWGIGKSSYNFLLSLGIKDALSLKKIDDIIAKQIFDKGLLDIWQELNGINVFDIKEKTKLAKSIQRTRTVRPSIPDESSLLSELSIHVEEATREARINNLFSDEIYFFLKTNDFKYIGHNLILPRKTNSPEIIMSIIRENFNNVYSSGIKYRTTGVILKNLSEGNFQESLFNLSDSKFKLKNVYEKIDILSKDKNLPKIFLASSLKSENMRQSKIKSLKKEFLENNLKIPLLGEVF